MVLPLVLTTSCGEREEGERREERERERGRGEVGWRSKTLNAQHTSLLVQIHNKLISVYQSSCVVWRGRVELKRV